MRKLMLLAVLIAPAGLAAQSTGTPVFEAPYRAFGRSEVGLSMSDQGSGSGLALEGSYRAGHRNWDIGFRGGFWDTNAPGSSTAILLGVDGRTRVVTHSESFPLDGALTVGAGVQLLDNFNTFMIPVGISLGRRLDLEGSTTSFVPYFQPVLTPTFVSGGSDLFFSVGLGTDIKFNRQFDLRVSGAIGDMNGIGITAAWLH